MFTLYFCKSLYLVNLVLVILQFKKYPFLKPNNTCLILKFFLCFCFSVLKFNFFFKLLFFFIFWCTCIWLIWVKISTLVYVNKNGSKRFYFTYFLITVSKWTANTFSFICDLLIIWASFYWPNNYSKSTLKIQKNRLY